MLLSVSVRPIRIRNYTFCLRKLQHLIYPFAELAGGFNSWYRITER